MPSVLKRPAANEASQLAQVSDLVGGLNRRVSQTLIKPNEARRLRNVSLSSPGEWTPRMGWETFTANSLGNSRSQGAKRVYDATGPYTVWAYGGHIYTQPDNGSAATSRYASLHATNPVDFPSDLEFVGAFDASHVPVYSSDSGVTWHQLGITAPVSAPTVTHAVAAGSLIDGHDYELAYAYQNQASGQPPSNGSPIATVTIAAPNLQFIATCAASADTQVDTIVLYVRDVTAGEEVKRWSATIANPGVGTVAFTVSSNNWEDGAEIPTTNDVAPILEGGVVWKNRWWGFSGTRVSFSELFQSLSWPSFYYVELPFTQGDTIAAIADLGDSLVVFGHSPTQVFLIVGQTSLDFEIRPAFGAQGGAFGFRAWTKMDGGIGHACADGVYLFDGANDRLLSYNIDVDWRAMVAAMTADELTRIPMVYHRRDKEIRIATTQLPIYGAAGEWVLNLTRSSAETGPAWSTTDRSIGGYLVWDGEETVSGTRGRLQSWGLTSGRLYTESTGTDADGSDLVCDYEGPIFTTGYYQARFLNIYGEFEPNAGTFSVEPFVDGVSQGAITIPIGSGVSTYGTAVYGLSVYGGPSRKTFMYELPLTAEGKNIYLLAQYSGQAAFRWFTYGINIKPESEIRGQF